MRGMYLRSNAILWPLLATGLSVLIGTFAVFAPVTVHAEEPISIFGVPPDPKLSFVLGTAWALYLDGTIDGDAGKRLEAYIEVHHVPDSSWVILNSPGGNLFGGMELGRVIRKHDLRTDIGIREAGSDRTLAFEPGGCYSACTLAYLGGSFRFLNKGSHFGIHRFAFTAPQKDEADLAQIASASIMSYLTEMGVDNEFFALSTLASSQEIYEPLLDTLKKLNAVTYGFQKPTWSIESNNGDLYLKGQRQTVYGLNKFIMFCLHPRQMTLYAIFDPQRRDNELLAFPAHSLVIDEKSEPIRPLKKEIKNGWFNAFYALTPSEVSRIARAQSVGVIVRPAYDAPAFLGFNSLPLNEGANKLKGLLKSCGF
jgi:hypothetical protein